MSGSGRDSFPPSRLGALQRDVLEAFFRRERRFFLTGGAALAGFYLGHRTSLDLDLFTAENVLAQGVAALGEAARELGAELEPMSTSPEFLRFLVRRGGESVVVDLVRDRTETTGAAKRSFGVVLVDPPEEILANKLCALLSRAELRDLVDVEALEAAGYRMEEALPTAARKDAGLTTGQLAWVLSQIEIGEDARLPGGASVAGLRRYLQDLISRLSRMAYPGS